MTPAELHRHGAAILAASTAGDADGVHELLDDLNLDETRHVLAAFAMLLAETAGTLLGSGEVLNNLRANLLERAGHTDQNGDGNDG